MLVMPLPERSSEVCASVKQNLVILKITWGSIFAMTLTILPVRLESSSRPLKESIVTNQTDTVLLRTDFPEMELYASGKVRDLYRVSNDYLLFVATDRISAFDYVLASGIPRKGEVLTQLSLFWFDFLKDVVPNHLVTANVNEYPEPLK